jgi:hypothetical protein
MITTILTVLIIFVRLSLCRLGCFIIIFYIILEIFVNCRLFLVLLVLL